MYLYICDKKSIKKKPRELHTANMMAHFSKEIDNSPQQLKTGKIFWSELVTNLTEVWKIIYKILEYSKEAACFFSLLLVYIQAEFLSYGKEKPLKTT